jgi:hypothetical protein
MPIPVSQHYPELLHYTTFAGLRGILSSGSLWATDAAFLNDSSEIRHFFDERLRELITEDARQYAIELARMPNHLVQIIKDGGFEKVVALEVEAWHSSLRRATLAMNRPFVLSLSAPNDERVQHSGLLSQWRGYGDDGGFAIVFDAQELESMLKAEAFAHRYMFVQIGDVYYHEIDPKIQPATSDITEYENIVHQAVYRAMRGDTLEEKGELYEAVTALSCLYKHWGFWEEREVRVVVVPAGHDVVANDAPKAIPQKEVLLRNRGGQEIPYIELFSSVGLAGTTAPLLPIKRVIVGPHKNREAHAESVRQELDRVGYAVDVVQSKIPYIGR